MGATSIWLVLCAGIVPLMVMPIWCSSVSAQITPDSTLNTTVSQSGDNFTITNGNRVGNNLFHSFSQFSVPSNGSALFNNAADVQNIFSRITGGSVSNIDGLIKANGSANLFLLNPSGIIFGANAQLNIGGSFIGTTANSIKFADGVEFSAINPQANPLLSINVPIGLQMGNNPSSIQVQGTGHALTITTILAPLIRTPSPTKLQVQPGKTLALVGGNLNLNGATLNAETGQIELGSLGGSGLVTLVPNTQGYTLRYENGQSFGDIQLAQKSLLNVSGVNSGSVQLQGRKIKFTDGSLVLTTNLGNLPSGNIHLQASEAIDIIGTTSDAKIRSWIRSEALGIGTGANIYIITPRLTLQEGSGLNNTAFGVANSGQIQIEASAIELSGSSAVNPSGVTSIATTARGTGTAGDIFVNSDSLLVSDGASLSSLTFGQGSSGQVNIRNRETTVRGDNPAGLYSNISVLTYGTGSAKTLTLNTARLQVLDGGVVAGTSFFIGNGGDISVNATESIQISGRSRLNQSSINSSVLKSEPLIRKLFGLADILTANAGNVSVTTPNLILQDGGTLSVTNQGTGNGGNLNITADRIQLKNQGLIQAQTESGNGGNIGLQVEKLLLIRDRSQITATAGGSGDGGNININAPIVAGLENSDIIANAVKGRGGNIQIATREIIGLQYRPQITAENDITASSQFGVNGTVDINNFGVDPNSGLVELPVKLTDSSQQIATSCSSTTGSSFVTTGRGGIPQNPTQEIGSDRTWSDIRDISAYRKTGEVKAQIPTSSGVLLQATSWHRNADGKIELITDKSPVQVQQALDCAAIGKS
ncbi:filamentous hemagglutinin [Nostoc sp. ATCC 53789]|uniref:two-partner secretion domain-containing protein n=2 Tax=Nostoc sp. ATCC 53789 TaxID=76335 RepID=UPI000DEC71B1|nr:filamentous hemagglutinin N-terminal domain-containing protein [Nostoc sp. ATCC 53789]RCJ16416.1 filamentous hemagglutinin [Nostoc sp. ATCC 53789]